MDKPKLISVVMPVYNAERFLKQALDSCLNQTYPNIELIAVDDGSTDGTRKILGSYSDSRLRVVAQDHRGLPAALNSGFNQTRGEYLTWIAGDDYYELTAIEEMAEILERHSETDLVFANHYLINASGEILEEVQNGPTEGLLFHNAIGPCCIYRREVYFKAGPFNNAAFLVEDYEFWLRASLSFRFQHLNRFLYSLRRHSESLTIRHWPKGDISERLLEVQRRILGNDQKNYTLLSKNHFETARLLCASFRQHRKALRAAFWGLYYKPESILDFRIQHLFVKILTGCGGANLFSAFARKIRSVRNNFFAGNLIRTARLLKDELSAYRTLFPPGHYYSALPSVAEIRQNENEIFSNQKKPILGIELNEGEQVDLLRSFEKFYQDFPFREHQTGRLRFKLKNDWFSHFDAVVLFCMIRHLRPQRIIEVGGGYSSCLILDANEIFFQKKISHAVIEPYSQKLVSLIRESDQEGLEIIPKKMQQTSPEIFLTLGENDILFVDSTHVSKAGSDVNYLFFEILPRLRPGVWVHFHDVFWPFEYDRDWVYRGIAWNEAYVLRAFLQYNRTFKITLYNAFLNLFYQDWLQEHMPLCLKAKGSSLWLKKTA